MYNVDENPEKMDADSLQKRVDGVREITARFQRGEITDESRKFMIQVLLNIEEDDVDERKSVLFSTKPKGGGAKRST